jgi:K+-transporting ATPase KdpF subunit
MKPGISISFMMLLVSPDRLSGTATEGNSGYLIGGIIALLILGYLVYALFKPEKF